MYRFRLQEGPRAAPRPFATVSLTLVSLAFVCLSLAANPAAAHHGRDFLLARTASLRSRCRCSWAAMVWPRGCGPLLNFAAIKSTLVS